MFVQLLCSILLFNFHSIPIYVSPQVPLQVGSPTLTILKLRSFLSSRWPHSIGDHTLHSWPHSTGKPHSTHYNVGHTVKVISLFFILDFSWGHCRGDFVQEAQFWWCCISFLGLPTIIIDERQENILNLAERPLAWPAFFSVSPSFHSGKSRFWDMKHKKGKKTPLSTFLSICDWQNPLQAVTTISKGWADCCRRSGGGFERVRKYMKNWQWIFLYEKLLGDIMVCW